MSRKRKHISHLSFKIFLRIGQLAKKKQNKTKNNEEKKRYIPKTSTSHISRIGAQSLFGLYCW